VLPPDAQAGQHKLRPNQHRLGLVRSFPLLNPRHEPPDERLCPESPDMLPVQRHAFRELSHLLQRNQGVLGGSSEQTIRLSAVAPHTPTDPFPRDTFAQRINRSRSIAVGNDTWVRHPDAKRILTFLDIALDLHQQRESELRLREAEDHPSHRW
jgi:hypothetical protein